jgi:hypothetical protein
MSDLEWDAIVPFLPRDPAGRGRPMLGTARARLDAVFRVVSQKLAWGEAGHQGVAAETVARQYRRWAAAGVFARLLKQVAKGERARGVPAALRRLTHWICAAHRCSARVYGVRGIALARRLGMLSALPRPSWMLPDPVLSGHLQKRILAAVEKLPEQRPARWEWRLWRRLLRFVADRPRIPACVVPA